MLITGKSIGDLYPKLLQTLLGGAEVSPRGQRTSEQLGMVLHGADLTQNILVHPVRDLNYRFMVAEWVWIMAGREDVESLAKYNSEMRKFSDDGKTLTGAYGPRLRGHKLHGETIPWGDQLAWCVQKLREDPDSRQAVCSIWTPCPGPSKDVPCTVSLQFFVRKYKLEVIVTMRSSDAWLGLPYDFFTFSMIGNCMAGELGVKPGGITLQLGSSHLYERDWTRATELIARWEETETVRSPVLPSLPATGLFDDMLDDFIMWGPYSYVVGPQCTTKLEALEVLRVAS